MLPPCCAGSALCVTLHVHDSPWARPVNRANFIRLCVLCCAAGFAQAQAQAVATAVSEALTCGCPAGAATAQALAQAVAEAGGCGCVPNLSNALAGDLVALRKCLHDGWHELHARYMCIS